MVEVQGVPAGLGAEAAVLERVAGEDLAFDKDQKDMMGWTWMLGKGIEHKKVVAARGQDSVQWTPIAPPLLVVCVGLDKWLG
jgi:hypothetical protein